MIELRTLGGLDLRDADGRELSGVLRQPKRFALLAYLAVATPRGFHRRDTLLGLFWPELDQEHARNALNQAVHVLRHSLGVDVITSRGEELGLTVGAISCDANELERALEQNEPAKALDLYGGDFLTGFFIPAAAEFERWLEDERTRLRERARSAASSLTVAEEMSGNLIGAAHWARRAAALAPESESALCRLVTLLERAGDRAAALRAYDEFADRLAKEYEAEPSTETRALMRAVRARANTVSAPSVAKTSLAGETRTNVGLARESSNQHLRLQPAEQSDEDGRAVLVLEFENISGDPDADWLSTGIAEAVSADLSKIAGIKVVRQDAATRRAIETIRQDHAIDGARATELARSVGASWVIWGGFQKSGSRIRITPRFVDVREGALIAGEKIDGTMSEIFELQDRIVGGLAGILRIQLTSAEVARIQKPQTANLTAYEHFARGHRAYLQFGKESARIAAEHFRAAIAADPKYALAYAGLGGVLASVYIATGRREVLDEGVAHLERALALDPSLGEAYGWLAYMQVRQQRFDDAERTSCRGIERDPSSFLSWYTLGAAHLGRGFMAHQPTELARCVPPLLRCLALNPTYHPVRIILGAVYTLRGAYAQAVELVDGAVEAELSGAGFMFLGSLVQRAILYIGSGQFGAAAPLLDQAIQRYTAADHVYAELTTAFAHFARGCLVERSGAADQALADFSRACAIADANDHRINIGAHWVKARFGVARALHRSGKWREAQQALTDGQELFASQSRFVWTWFIGGADADVLYEEAATLATLGHSDDALGALRRAADAGWADVIWLRHDPAFETLRDSPDVRRLCADATSRVTLPPPVGSGGLV